MMINDLISKEDFAAFVGEPYQGNEDDSNAYLAAEDLPVIDADTDDGTYTNIVEMFDDDDGWIGEWLYCRSRNIPFTYTLCTSRCETINRIMSADEFYDFLLEIKKKRNPIQTTIVTGKKERI